MRLHILLLKKIMFSKEFFRLPFFLSFLGLSLAVMALTSSLLAFHGVSESLETVIINQRGHIRVESPFPIPKNKLFQDLKSFDEFFKQKSPFLSFEALVLNKGKVKAVFFEALEQKRLEKVSQEKGLVLGRVVAESVGVSVGDEVLVVSSSGENFETKKATFSLGEISDFGRHDLNSYLALLPLKKASLLGKKGISGAHLWLKNPDSLNEVKFHLKKTLKDYQIETWKEADQSFLTDIEFEKRILFFLLMILVVSAGFNVASSFFVQVFQKTKGISILKTMGMEKLQILLTFLFSSLVMSFFGVIFGIILGLCLWRFLIFLQDQFLIIPSEIYNVSGILWTVSPFDLLLIFFASLFVCLVSSFFPALRACQMSVSEGLSYE